MPCEQNASNRLKVKQIPVVHSQSPAVVVHGLADARAVLAVRQPVTLLSAAGAVLFAGCGWWRAVIERARSEYSAVPFDDILDCADASGLALGALRMGQRRLVLGSAAPGWQSVAAITASLGGELLTSRPPALDMADRDAARRLHKWLQIRTTQGDNDDAVS
jgi:hypothetical protein